MNKNGKRANSRFRNGRQLRNTASENGKINVLQIVRIPLGGIRKHIISIINNLDAERFESFLASGMKIADDGFKRDLDREKLPNENVFDIDIRQVPGPRDIRNIVRLYRHYKQKDVRIIHGHGAKGGLYARVLGALLSAKVLYTAHGGSIHTMHGPFNNAIYKIMEKILYHLTDKVVFESEYSRKRYMERIKRSSTKFILNYNGVKLCANPASPSFKKDKEIRIGAFGQLRKIKGYDVLIKAVSELTNRGYNIKAEIHGEGEEEENLSTLAKELGIKERVAIHCFSQEIEARMRSCHIIVQPSRFESFGYVAVEAMSLGIPVIASNVGGLAEIVKHEKNGLLIDPGNHMELTDSIEKIISDSILRESMIQNGLKTVSEKFSEEKMAQTIKKIYLELTLG